MPKRDDKLLLDDILEAGNKIIRYVQGVDFTAFNQNEEKVDAVIRNFEVIGEAAGNLSASFKQKHPQIAWRKINGYRNRLIHEYFGIDLSIVWNIIQSELPQLLEEIKDGLEKID